MLKIREFLQALKLTWTRKLLKENEQNEWSKLCNLNTYNTFILGGNYAKRTIDQNKKSVLETFSRSMVQFNFCI